MNIRALMLTVMLLPLVACGDEPSMEMDMEMDGGAAMGEMDHSQHQMGAPAERQAVHLTPEQERALGVRYYTVEPRALERTIRTVGRIVASESRVADVSPKIEGFVETLAVNTTGASVRQGEPLMTVYSPALVAAQEELVIASRLAAEVGDAEGIAAESARSMLEAARRRLRYWDITDAQIADL